MNWTNRVKNFYILTIFLLFVFVLEIVYFSYFRKVSENEKIKNNFVKIVMLPDLSIATEARFIRFRSLSDVYSPFNEAPECLDYFPSTFVYYPYVKNIPSRIVIK